MVSSAKITTKLRTGMDYNMVDTAIVSIFFAVFFPYHVHTGRRRVGVGSSVRVGVGKKYFWRLTPKIFS